MSLQISETRTKLFKALVEFRGAVKQPSKDGTNPFTKSKYVTLDALVKTIDEFAPVFGLTYIQVAKTDEHGRASVSTIVMHDSGEYMELAPLALPVDKNTAQAYGSSITYARRYTLSAAFGLASEDDDDGNMASGRGSQQQYQPQYQQPQQRPPQHNYQQPPQQNHQQRQQQAPQGQQPSQQQNQQPKEPPMDLGDFMAQAKAKEAEIMKNQPDFGTKKIQGWILGKMGLKSMNDIPEDGRRDYLGFADQLVNASKDKKSKK